MAALQTQCPTRTSRGCTAPRPGPSSGATTWRGSRWVAIGKIYGQNFSGHKSGRANCTPWTPPGPRPRPPSGPGSPPTRCCSTTSSTGSTSSRQVGKQYQYPHSTLRNLKTPHRARHGKDELFPGWLGPRPRGGAAALLSSPHQDIRHLHRQDRQDILATKLTFIISTG